MTSMHNDKTQVVIESHRRLSEVLFGHKRQQQNQANTAGLCMLAVGSDSRYTDRVVHVPPGKATHCDAAHIHTNHHVPHKQPFVDDGIRHPACTPVCQTMSTTINSGYRTHPQVMSGNDGNIRYSGSPV